MEPRLYRVDQVKKLRFLRLVSAVLKAK